MGLKTEFSQCYKPKGKVHKSFCFSNSNKRINTFIILYIGHLNEIKTFPLGKPVFALFFYWSNHFLHSLSGVLVFQERSIPKLLRGTFQKERYDAGLLEWAEQSFLCLLMEVNPMTFCQFIAFEGPYYTRAYTPSFCKKLRSDIRIKLFSVYSLKTQRKPIFQIGLLDAVGKWKRKLFVFWQGKNGAKVSQEVQTNLQTKREDRNILKRRPFQINKGGEHLTFFFQKNNLI